MQKTTLQHNAVNRDFQRKSLLLNFFLYFLEKDLGVFYVSIVYYEMITNKTQKNAKQYNCETCNFKCSNKYDYNRHIATRKHQILTNTYTNCDNKTSNTYTCDCGKKYKHRQSLNNHKKKCQYIDKEEEAEIKEETEQIKDNTIVPAQNENITPEMLNILKEYMMLQLAEKDKQLAEKDKQIAELIPRIGNNNTTNNTNNNTFNVMLYLNDQCKDALSIQKFMTDIEVTEDDVISMSKHKNPTDNFTNLILKSLKNIDITERPFHCTDEHRGTLYIKNDSGWDNDKKRERDREQIKNDESWDKTTAKDNVISNALKKTINMKPFNAITNYRKNHPNSRELDTPEYVLAGKAEINTYCDCTDEEDLSNTTQKVMKNLRPKIKLNKDTVK